MRIARRKVGAALLPRLAPSTLRALSASWRVERVGHEHLDAARNGSGCIATMWHGRMLVPLPAHAHMGMQILVSPSDDGSLVKPLLDRFGYGVVRGSSNKNPARALRELLHQLEEGATVVITPDGPRGPLHSVNPGPAWMAKVTGLPLLPCGFVAARAWHLKSWDRFTIPKWRARVALVYGEPIHVARDADEDEQRRATEQMRARMLSAEEEGFRRLGAERDW